MNKKSQITLGWICKITGFVCYGIAGFVGLIGKTDYVWIPLVLGSALIGIGGLLE